MMTRLVPKRAHLRSIRRFVDDMAAKKANVGGVPVKNRQPRHRKAWTRREWGDRQRVSKAPGGAAADRTNGDFKRMSKLVQ